MEYYKLKLCNLERDLPIVETKSGLKIAGFDSVGDAQLLYPAGKELSLLLSEQFTFIPDYIITTEVKGIPISQEVCNTLGVNCICLRKEPKIYMGKCVEFEGSSITSGNSKYYISEKKAEELKGKSVMFVDDVYSTGNTMELIIDVCKQLDCNLVGAGFILKEANSVQGGMPIMFEHRNIKCYALDILPLQ